jgi:uncharacterized protein
MASAYHDTLFTPVVVAAQARAYGAGSLARTSSAPAPTALGLTECAFIRARDSFYLATVGETGWPYVQHRGGPPGFLAVLEPGLLAFADLRGNRQLLSAGHTAVNTNVSLLLMDYPQRSRLKIIGHARVLETKEHPRLAAQLVVASPQMMAERIFLIDVVGYDWNCPKYITPRYTASEVEEITAPLRQKIAALEARLTPPSGS